MNERHKLPRAFYTRNTLLVARSLLGMYLVRRLPSGKVLRGRIVETEAYAGIFDPGSHTYQDRRTERTQIWYGNGGFAYVYQIYGSYCCLGLITEAQGRPGAVLIRALEPIDGFEMVPTHDSETQTSQLAGERLCAGPAKLCLAMQIDRHCNGLDLCGDELYLEAEDGYKEAPMPVADMVFAPRINIDYAGAGALFAWRYYLSASAAVSRRTYEPLRDWRQKGYPSGRGQRPLDLFAALVRHEEEVPLMSDETEQAFLQALPKVELHLHLEGCMTLATLRTLCVRNRRPLPYDLQSGDQHTFETFAEFAHVYHTICQAIMQPQDFALVIADVAAYLKRNHILYAEVAWTPFLYLNRGFRFAEVMDVLNAALVTEGVADRVRFLIDIQRDHGLEAGAWVYQQVFAARSDQRIVGIGLTGQEEGFPPEEFRTLYHQAQAHGLGTTAHAGEYGTAEDIRQCLDVLGVRRIGHGLRAIHDPHLLTTLVERQIHLEVCLTSNVRLERVLTYSAHPLRQFWQAGVALGLNTDDPGLLGIDLASEYAKAMSHCGLTQADLVQTVHHSLHAAFLPAEQKQQLHTRIAQEWSKTDGSDLH